MENLSNTLSSIDTITIPVDATAEGLVAEAEAEFKQAGIPITYFSRGVFYLIRQDLPSVLGKTLNVHVHDFDCEWEPSEGRTYQTGQGCDGNAAAHLVWVTKRKPMGYFLTIPNDDARLFRPSEGNLSFPDFGRDHDYRGFDLHLFRRNCHSFRSLVAFSEMRDR